MCASAPSPFFFKISSRDEREGAFFLHTSEKHIQATPSKIIITMIIKKKYPRTRAEFHRFRGNTKCKATPLAKIRLRAAEEWCTPPLGRVRWWCSSSSQQQPAGSELSQTVLVLPGTRQPPSLARCRPK